MPNAATIEAAVSKLFVREDTDAGPRWRRVTAPPRGAAGPVLAETAPRKAPQEPLGCPDPFPLEWLEVRPGWLEPKEGVRIVLDGPETGRAAGYVRVHGTCYQNGTGSCILPPEVDYEAFYRGEAQVIDEHGEIRETAVGSIAIVDGHSDPKGTHRAAIAHLDKPEKMKLRGVLIEDEVGLLFLGCGRPDMTRAEAVMVNQSDTSGEWWPLYEMDESGRVGLIGKDLIGIALVASGAYRKSIPDRFKVIAAALGRELDDEEVALMFEEMAASAGSCGCGGVDACACRETAEPETAGAFIDEHEWRQALVPAVEVPVLAAPTEDAVAELQAQVAELVTKIEALTVLVDGVVRKQTQFAAEQMTEEEITLPDRVDQQEDVQRQMEERLRRLEAKTEEQGVVPTVTAEGPAGATDMRPAGVPVGV